jgi:hypothetical protein
MTGDLIRDGSRSRSNLSGLLKVDHLLPPDSMGCGPSEDAEKELRQACAESRTASVLFSRAGTDFSQAAGPLVARPCAQRALPEHQIGWIRVVLVINGDLDVYRNIRADSSVTEGLYTSIGFVG